MIGKALKILGLSVLLLTGIFSLPSLTVFAATTGTVAATVTAVIYSVSLDNGDGIAFGSVAQNSTKDTTTGAEGVNDSVTATNNGSVAEKLSIKAGNSTDWTLDSTNATAEHFTMKYCVTTCDTSPSWVSVGIDPSYATLVSSVAKDGTQVFDLQIGTPSTTVETGEQSVTVTILAEAP